MAALTCYPGVEDSYSKADDWCLLGKPSSDLQGQQPGQQLGALSEHLCKVHVANSEPEALGTNLSLNGQF